MDPTSNDSEHQQIHQLKIDQCNVENSTARIYNEHKSGGDAAEEVDDIGSPRPFKEYKESIMAQGGKLDNSNQPDEQMNVSIRRAEIKKLIDDMNEVFYTVTMTGEQRAEVKELIDDVVETINTTDDQITFSTQKAEIKTLIDNIKSKYKGDETGTTGYNPCHGTCSSSCRTQCNKVEDRSRPTFKTNQSCRKLLQARMTWKHVEENEDDGCLEWKDGVGSGTESGPEMCRKNRKKEDVTDEEDLEHHKPKPECKNKTSVMSRYDIVDDFDFVNGCVQSKENSYVDRDLDTDLSNATPSQVGMRQLFESEEIISANCVRHLKDLRKSLNKIMRVLLFFEAPTSCRVLPLVKRSGDEVAEFDLSLPTCLKDETSASDGGNLSPTALRAAEETLLRYMLDVETQLHSELVSLNDIGSRVEDLNVTASEWQSGGETSAGGDETSAGGETSTGGDETRVGGGETSAGGDETSAGGCEASAGGGEISTGGDETSAGGDETSTGGDETSTGGDETSAGGVEASAGDDESSTSCNETRVGGDETSADDDAVCTVLEDVGIV